MLPVEARVNGKTDAARFHSLENLNALEGRIAYGFSPATFGNMAIKYGGEQARVNRDNFARVAGFKPESLAIINPEHSNRVLVVGREERGRDLPPADGLITLEPDVSLALLPADCTPIVITDNNTQFVALVHAGRQGTDRMVCQEAIRRLKELGFDPEDLIVGIGPTIGCYEQGYLLTRCPSLWLDHISVAGGSPAEITIDPDDDRGYRIHHVDNYPLWVDLVGCNVSQLVEAGVPRQAIKVSDICTRCYAERGLSYSHSLSAENPENREGRFIAFARLVSE